MINLKRNKKYELVTATGKRTKLNSIYQPGQKKDFKISRGKFNDFLKCQRCFYLDRIKGFVTPSMPGWTLNETTDYLLKKEFDICRLNKTPHRLHLENNLEHIIPFSHKDLDKWRDSLHYGLSSRFKSSNIILTGGIDDIWEDTRNKKLIIVDYKSQASNYKVRESNYLNSTYRDNYKIQIDFYAYLLSEMGFDVSPVSYFYVCNAIRDATGFYGKMNFDETLISYKWNSSWIPKKVYQMINQMNSKNIPLSNQSCENCAYSRQRSQFDKLETAKQMKMFDL